MVGTLDDLQKLVRESENSRVELKREISREVIRGLSTDIAALANCSGGNIIFGFSDSKEPVGCAFTSKDLDQISQQAGECRPSVTINFEKFSFGTQRFLIVKVPKASVLHSDIKHRFPVRIGSATNFLDISGIHSLMRERGLIRGEGSEVSSLPIERPRKPLSDSVAPGVMRSLGSENADLRLETLKDMASLSHRYILFEHQAIAALAERILESGSENEVEQLLDPIRWAILRGTSSELETIGRWVEKIEKIGETAESAEVARKAFDVLQCAGLTEAIDLLVYWIEVTDDKKYSALRPNTLLANVRFYGLDQGIREAMYSLLEAESKERTKNRILAILEAVRRAY